MVQRAKKKVEVRVRAKKKSLVLVIKVRIVKAVMMKMVVRARLKARVMMEILMMLNQVMMGLVRATSLIVKEQRSGLTVKKSSDHLARKSN